MAAYDLEEQEKLDELKTWWKMYGNLVTGVVTLAAVAMLAWQGWNWWQRSQAAQASNLYSVLQQAAGQKDAKRSRDVAGELIDKYSGTAYAGMAAVLSAKVQAESGDSKTARAQLAWAVDHAADDTLRDLARLRLAAIMIDDKDYDDAARQLAAGTVPALAPRFAEARGDALAAQGKTAEAKAAYQEALSKLEPIAKSDPGPAHAPYREMIETKIDGLGGGQ